MASATPIGNSGSATRTNKVRVVGKIRGFADSEIASGPSKCSVQITKPNGEAPEKVTVSFGERAATGRKENYELDFCYEQNDLHEMIFSREVEPLIAGVFDGFSATVIANGAKGSGKTCLMQGFDEKLGLASLAVSKILQLSEQYGKFVSVSLYEVYQEQVFDILDRERRMVSVFENAQRKIQLKGLSQVPLRCMSEFWKLRNGNCSSERAVKKIPNEIPRRSHQGLIIYVSSFSKNSETVLVGKMNFIDMAGYEDARRNTNDGRNIVKSANVNKSLYALHHVINALTRNEIRVPYRESKLTHMLQDSLGGMNKILMFVCLNPSFCQDSIYMVSLASQSCQGNNRPALNSIKKKSSARAVVSSSHRKISSSISTSMKTTSMKTNTGFRTQLLLRKGNDTKPAIKGRKLFEEESQPHKLAQEITSLDMTLKVDLSVKEEKGTSISDVVEPGLATVVESSPPSSSDERTTVKDVYIDGSNNFKEGVTCDSKELISTEKGCQIGKENDSLIVNESKSPPLSYKLQELSNSLKMLQTSSTPLSVQVPIQGTEIPLTPVQIPMNDTMHSVQISGGLSEPKTPEPNLRTNEIANIGSSWKRFNQHSSAVKNTLVQEYLKFLNTADKEELKRLKGIGEKRATYILELREESPEPFKNLDDIQDIGLSAKQIKKMMKDELGELFK